MRKLREHDIHHLDDVERVVVETKGGFSVLRKGAHPVDEVLRRGLDHPRHQIDTEERQQA